MCYEITDFYLCNNVYLFIYIKYFDICLIYCCFNKIVDVYSYMCL